MTILLFWLPVDSEVVVLIGWEDKTGVVNWGALSTLEMEEKARTWASIFFLLCKIKKKEVEQGGIKKNCQGPLQKKKKKSDWAES